MYHVDVLHSEDGHRAYEFLIEFCTNDPSVGIYYGCRGFTKKHYNHDKEIRQFIADYQAVREELIQKHFGMEVVALSSTKQPTNSPYNMLLRECSTYAYDHAPLFESILRHLEADGIFVREAGEEHLWRFMGAPKHSANADFSRLIYLIFSEFIHSKKSQLEDNAKLVQWRLIRSVFLDKNGNAFKDSIRTQWQYEGRTDAKTDFWRTKITSLL
ncbi:MAG: hypothetical protein IKY87_03175 [Paludibacteraceae bacterium]|nr:hypothetical protein [Paludibacteraceae bacterium]